MKFKKFDYRYKRPPNSTWTEEREGRLRQLYDEDVPISEMALVFELTQGSIRAKLKQLGCSSEYVEGENKKAAAVENTLKKVGWKRQLTLKDLNDV